VDVAVERRLAEALDLSTGDTVRISAEPGAAPVPAVVRAVYEPETDPSSLMKQEYHLRMHLPDLASLVGHPDAVDRIAVGLRPGVPPDTAAARLNTAAFGYRAWPSAELAAGSSATFRVISRFHRAIAVIAVVASAIFLLCIMLLKVEERRQDAATLRLMGISRRTIFGALLIEATLVAGLGSVAGIVFAWAGSVATNAFYQHRFATTLVFSVITPGVVAFSVGLSLVLGIVAGAVAAWRLVRTPPLVLQGR
jgi:putative ABC transport system permease protein